MVANIILWMYCAACFWEPYIEHGMGALGRRPATSQTYRTRPESYVVARHDQAGPRTAVCGPGRSVPLRGFGCGFGPRSAPNFAKNATVQDRSVRFL